MKKQFSIKPVQKNNVSAAKKEAHNLLKFLKPGECCEVMPYFHGLNRETVFSL
ncbi:hypothetical protein [Fibrisoma montanum]|uniref:hypothetical protein n=1 Tax=Fibrisoma montanum TaxID=2305895 RepID=UPI0018F41D85|nr:hypothetical protein [Fibrisoma montanum]